MGCRHQAQIDLVDLDQRIGIPPNSTGECIPRSVFDCSVKSGGRASKERGDLQIVMNVGRSSCRVFRL